MCGPESYAFKSNGGIAIRQRTSQKNAAYESLSQVSQQGATSLSISDSQLPGVPFLNSDLCTFPPWTYLVCLNQQIPQLTFKTHSNQPHFLRYLTYHHTTESIITLLSSPTTELCKGGFSSNTSGKIPYHNTLNTKANMRIQLFLIKPDITEICNISKPFPTWFGDLLFLGFYSRKPSCYLTTERTEIKESKCKKRHCVKTYLIRQKVKLFLPRASQSQLNLFFLSHEF